MEYPSLQDIYDLATDDLRKLQQILKRNPENNTDLLDAIVLQIDERKTLEYFSELCQAENPYAKKLADFNSEFLKLANQALQRNESIVHENEKELEKQLSSHAQQTTIEDNSNKNTIYSVPRRQNTSNASTINRKQTDSDCRSIQSQCFGKSDNISVTSMKSKSKESHQTDNKSEVSMTKKMNLGLKKSKKGELKNIMQSTLARTQIDEAATLKRSSAISSQPKNEKKFHIPGQKHQNLELRQKKPPLNPNKPNQEQPKSNRKPTVSQANADQAQKKKQTLAKMKKQGKNSSVKLPKIKQNKDLVKMIKEEQQAKRKAKTEKLIREQKQKYENNFPSVKPDESLPTGRKKKDEQIIQEIENFSGGDTDRKKSDQIIQEQIKQVILEQEIEQSLSPGKLQKIMLSKNKNEQLLKSQELQKNQPQFKNNYINTPSKKQNIGLQNGEEQKENIHISSAYIEKRKIKNEESSAQHKKCQKQQKECEKMQSKEKDGKQDKIIDLNIQKSENKKDQCENQKESKNDNNSQVNYMKKLLQQIDSEQKKHEQLIGDQKQIIQKDQEEEKNSESSPSKTQLTGDLQDDQEKKQKKCYSEQYWAHIRQQAELKIKRFRQEKQISQIQLQYQNKYSNDEEKGQKQQEDDSQARKQKEQEERLKRQEQEIRQKEEQLKKMKKQVMRKSGMKKNNQVKLPAPAKTIRPKPQFDYLSVYPTFNHIFSVTYMKSQMQANSDIPNIMRDIKTLFATHVEHFANRKTFQPAIFLPFDSTGNFKLTDPKQLLLHAENTYVDLKVIIQRVEAFNSNLQGHFNDNNENRYYRVVKSKQEVYDIISTSFLRRKGWKQLPHGCSLKSSWNFFWSWSKPEIDLGKLLVWQKINHFPFNKNLSRKDLLYKNLEYFRKAYRVHMNFLPLTFNLPKQFTQLSVKFHEQEMLNKDKNFWIMKPIGKSRGRGIKVISSLSQLNYIDNIVVQKYISNPLLLEGYKFDMRIYVLVTSFHPLEAFVYKEGFARLSTEKYSLDANSIKNTFIHLTNFSVNKNNVEGKNNFSSGSKISMKTLKDKLTRMGYSFPNIWAQVHDIIIKSLLGCSVSVPSFPTAFELFGYDVMIDQDGGCHLIQINSSPSLERSYMLDQIVKQNLIDDIVDIVDPPDFDKKELLDVFSERIQAMSGGKKIPIEDDLIGLARILKYKPIRKVGQMPQKLGLFQRVAPSPASQELQKLIKSKSGANNPQNID